MVPAPQHLFKRLTCYKNKRDRHGHKCTKKEIIVGVSVAGGVLFCCAVVWLVIRIMSWRDARREQQRLDINYQYESGHPWQQRGDMADRSMDAYTSHSAGHDKDKLMTVEVSRVEVEQPAGDHPHEHQQAFAHQDFSQPPRPAPVYSGLSQHQ